jgi:hypothetical protein
MEDRVFDKFKNKREGDAMTDLRRCRVFWGAFILFFVLTISAGCARLRGNTADLQETEARQEEAEPGPLYYDFGDVLVPLELKVDKNKSFVYHAPGFTAGVLALSGHVDVNSLIRFFENNMAKDNWRLVSSFKSPRTVMFFSKANRLCIVSITEKHFKSEVEIWVAPTTEDEEATLLK